LKQHYYSEVAINPLFLLQNATKLAKEYQYLLLQLQKNIEEEKKISCNIDITKR